MTEARVRPFFTDQWPAWLAGLLAIAGLVVFSVQGWRYAHTTISSLDEGAYLYKGYLFATGQYQPFQLYSVWTNKAPLAFLIPGYVQRIFGPGLGAGRILALLFGTLALIPLWAAARRLGGLWLAAAAVWVYALNTAVIKIYSEGVTQSTIFFLLACVLALSLGEDRPLWQLLLSGFLAGLMIFVRQNMALVLPLLVLYILWQQGWKPALYTALVGGAVALFFHVLYWPYIMQLWTPWLPDGLASLFDQFATHSSGSPSWSPSVTFNGRVLSFFQGVRFHLVTILGMVTGIVLWPRRRDWASLAEFRAAVFLGVMFVSLLLMHSWASISNDYCVFCFTPYTAFYSVSAVLFTVLLVRSLSREVHPVRQVILVLALLVIFTGIGYSAFEDWGDGLLALNVPRVSGGHLLPGFTTLWDMLSNKFALERNAAEKIVSTVTGAVAGLALLGLVFIVRRWKFPQLNGGYFLASSLLVLALFLAPFLAGSAAQPDCASLDVIAANEQVGAYLAQNIPAGSQVYWNGGLSVAPLLYASGIHIYPAQINDGYAFYVGGDSQELLKYGFWNDELAAQWLREADYVVVEGWRYANMKDALPPSAYDELPRSPSQTSCLDGSGLRIFKRK
jgi:4-amino-4-deoxy-L-arabinose transferase-like glycosyltransferase